jgi:asparaginyl-tRNA synthetase
MSIAQLTKFFAAQEFVQTHPPVITSSDCEGAGEVFGVVAGAEKSASPSSSGNVAGQHDDELFFRSPKYLTVSTQLHLEALAQAVGKVWTLSPTFRAEKSETNRHLSEFYMLEAEVAFVERLDGVMDVTENMLRDLTQALYDTSTVQEIIRGRRTGESKADAQQTYISQELEQRWKGMMSADWPRITYTEAVALLQESGQKFVHQPIWGNGLQAEHERFIASSVGKGKPVFVTHYPKSIKPFYMLPTAGQNPSGPTVDCFDLLVPEVCEITGGSMREHRLAELLNSMQQQGLISPAAAEKYGKDVDSDDLGSLQWYVDLRRWGSVPHGGFGLGFDRLIGYLSGVQNIRDVVAFPRWVGRCDC